MFSLSCTLQIATFLWPYLAISLENRIYDAHYPTDAPILSWRHKRKRPVREDADPDMPPDVAISIRNLEKNFVTSILHPKRGVVTALADLTLDIPKFGIFVLLGSNG